MTFWTMLMIRVDHGDAKAAAAAHTRRRAIEEAAETVPGFKYGETMLSADDPNLFCVMCCWENQAAYREWVASPVRAKREADLAGIISGDIKTLSFQSFHVVEKAVG